MAAFLTTCSLGAGARAVKHPRSLWQLECALRLIAYLCNRRYKRPVCVSIGIRSYERLIVESHCLAPIPLLLGFR